MPKLYLLHPAVVHFPLALLLTGLGAALAERWSAERSWLADAASWLLWLGTASAWAAVALGLLAIRTAPHVPPAWETVADHRALGFWTAGLFTALSAWRLRFRGRWPSAFLLFWLLGTAALVATAQKGGELVFTYNMGTAGSEP